MAAPRSGRIDSHHYPMKPRTITGIVLIALGVLALVYQGITYTSNRDTLDLGIVTITAEEKKTLPLPPIIGVLAIVGGAVLMVVDRRKA